MCVFALGNVEILRTFAPASTAYVLPLITEKASKKEVEKLQKKICQIEIAVVSLPTRKGSSSFTF